MVQALLDKRARLDSRGDLGRTPLSWAVCSGNDDVVLLLGVVAQKVGTKLIHRDAPLTKEEHVTFEEVAAMLRKSRLKDREEFSRKDDEEDPWLSAISIK